VRAKRATILSCGWTSPPRFGVRSLYKQISFFGGGGSDAWTIGVLFSRRARSISSWRS